MSEWSAIQSGGKTLPEFNRLRRQYLSDFHAHTGRNVILFASGWLQHKEPPYTMITDADVRPIAEICRNLGPEALDLVLHSEGGILAPTEKIVTGIRAKFPHVRIVVPQYAMSAAALMCCAADEIVMDDCASLGPIDPQFLLSTSEVVRFVPARAVLDEGGNPKAAVVNPERYSGDSKTMTRHHPALRVECANLVSLSRTLAARWLNAYMFHDAADASSGPLSARFRRLTAMVDEKFNTRTSRATKIADWWSDYEKFKSHERHISRDELRRQGLNVADLECDPTMWSICRLLMFSMLGTFTETGVAKIIENHRGESYIIDNSGRVEVEGL